MPLLGIPSLMVGRHRYMPYEPETTAYLENADVNILNDATIYFPSTAQEITGAEIWAELDVFVISLKTALGLPLKQNNLSTRFGYIFPFIGGTSGANAVDLVRGITYGSFAGGITHDPDGISFNGSNGWMNTTLVPSSTYNPNYYGYFLYNKAYTSGSLWGAYGTSSLDNEFPGASVVCLNGGFISATPYNTGNKSLYRTSGSQIKFRANGVQQTLSSAYNSGVSMPVALGARNESPNPTNYSASSFQMFGIVSQPTDAEIIDIETAMLDLQNTLNRA